jgi:lipid A disaccharide synthetase
MNEYMNLSDRCAVRVNLSIFLPSHKEDVITSSRKSEIVKHSDKFCETVANLVGKWS